MNEPITIAKVRKETTVKIPAGGYIVLRNPDESFADHVVTRTKLINADGTNEDYSLVITGRINNTHPILRLVTPDEKKARDKELEKSSKANERASKEASEREAKQKAEAKKKSDDEHAARLAKVNKENDSIRTK